MKRLLFTLAFGLLVGCEGDGSRIRSSAPKRRYIAVLIDPLESSYNGNASSVQIGTKTSFIDIDNTGLVKCAVR